MLEAIELLERLPAGHELAMAYANISQRRMVAEDTAEAIAWGNRALELARSLGDTEAEVYALSNIGGRRVPRQSGRRAGSSWSAALRARAASRPRRARRADLRPAGRCSRCDTAGSMSRKPISTPASSTALSEVSTPSACTCSGLAPDSSWMLGHWDEAADRPPRSCVIPVARSWPRTWALTTLGLLRARRGDAEALARRWKRRTQWCVQPSSWTESRRSMPPGPRQPGWPASTDRGGADHRRGARARGRPPRAMGRRRARLLAPASRAPRRAPRGTGRRALQAVDRRRLGARRRALARDRLPVRGGARARRRDDDEARAPSARRARKRWARVRQPRSSLGGCATRGVRGVPRGPRPPTRAEPGRPHRARARGAGAARRRTAQRRRSPQRLVVSEKTVEHHVSAILRKLDVRTRGEAAVKAGRLGLIAPRQPPAGTA